MPIERCLANLVAEDAFARRRHFLSLDLYIVCGFRILVTMAVEVVQRAAKLSSRPLPPKTMLVQHAIRKRHDNRSFKQLCFGDRVGFCDERLFREAGRKLSFAACGWCSRHSSTRVFMHSLAVVSGCAGLAALCRHCIRDSDCRGEDVTLL